MRTMNKVLLLTLVAAIGVTRAAESQPSQGEKPSVPAAGPPAKSWTLATDDTRLTLGVTAEGTLALSELSCPAVRWNWIARPVFVDLLSHVEVAGARKAVQWRLADAAIDDKDGQKLSLRLVHDDPALELISVWHARKGPGPIHHSMQIRNNSAKPVTIGEQSTFDMPLTGPVTMWCFHSDGGTPDAVGVYRHPLTTAKPGQRYSVRTTPSGEFIPYTVIEAGNRHGIYVGLEWSFCQIEALALSGGAKPAIRLRAGNVANSRVDLAPGQTFAVPPGFVGAYRGDLDDAGNRLRRWLFAGRVPEILRQDASYPKVQWNAFGATGKTPGSWDPVEKKYYPLVDDIATLGFEEVMIDVGWWQGKQPDFDRVDWSSGMKKAADYAHQKGMRFGLYFSDDLDMAKPEARQERAARIGRLFREYGADMWRSDCTRGAVIGSSYAATRGFYEMVDSLANAIPGFQWENCSGGGRIKDYGAMQRSVKIFNSDTYSPLHVRQAFHDSSFAFHPIQLEGHLGSINGRFRPQGIAGMRFAFRSMSMGAPEWFLDAPSGGNGGPPWTQEEKIAVKACVALYKAKLRPLVRSAELYHILPRPDGRYWDGIEYYDPIAGKGVVYLFKPASDALTEVITQVIHFKGLEAKQTYRLTFEDGTNPPAVKSGAELIEKGLRVTLEDPEASELVFFEAAR